MSKADFLAGTYMTTCIHLVLLLWAGAQMRAFPPRLKVCNPAKIFLTSKGLVTCSFSPPHIHKTEQVGRWLGFRVLRDY